MTSGSVILPSPSVPSLSQIHTWLPGKHGLAPANPSPVRGRRSRPGGRGCAVGGLRRLYGTLGGPWDANAWGVRVDLKPFVDWIWGGCLIMAMGGLLASCDRRYRARKLAAETNLALVGAKA